MVVIDGALAGAFSESIYSGSMVSHQYSRHSAARAPSRSEMNTTIAASLFISLRLGLVPQVRANEDVCFGAGVRPVLLVPGFLGSPLYDSERKFDVEWPDFDVIGRQYSFDPSPSDLDLPMRWDDDSLEQAYSPVGPERSPCDEHPSLESFVGDLMELTVYGHVRQLAKSFRHPQNTTLQMYYSVSWDWRRDLWEQSERVFKALQRIHSITSCKAIVVGHSFGANAIYATLARYRQEAVDLVAGTLYAAGSFHGSAARVASLTLDRSQPMTSNPKSVVQQPVDSLFTFASSYVMVPSFDTSCQNTDTLFSNTTFACGSGMFPTGLNCNSTACGRPESWPADEPFFLPLDMQDPDVWLKIGAAQPTLTDVTPEKETHLRKALQTARRMSSVTSGPQAAQVQAIHPPGAIVSLQIEDETLKPSPERPATMHHYLTCVPSDSFGQQNTTERWCKQLVRGGKMAGDGTLTRYMMELSGTGWERSIQTFRMIKRPSGWPQIGRGPHAAALLLAKTPSRTLVCAEQQLPDPSCAPTSFPSLEQLLCSLVNRANHPEQQGEIQLADNLTVSNGLDAICSITLPDTNTSSVSWLQWLRSWFSRGEVDSSAGSTA